MIRAALLIRRFPQWTSFILSLALVALAQAGDRTDDRKTLQGTWQVTDMHKREVPVDKPHWPLKIVFKDDVMEVHLPPDHPDPVRKTTFRLDDSARPRTMTFIDPATKKMAVGIYEFTGGDQLRICVPSDRPDFRPTEFKSDNGCVLFSLKRMK